MDNHNPEDLELMHAWLAGMACMLAAWTFSKEAPEGAKRFKDQTHADMAELRAEYKTKKGL